MRIEVIGEGHHITIPIPGWLVFNRLGIWLGLRFCRSGMTFLDGMSDREARQLLHEMGRMVKKYGHWELVHVESADGELVSITV